MGGPSYILPIFFGFSSKTRYKDSIHCHLDFWFLSTTFIHSYSVIPFVYIFIALVKLQNRAHLLIPIFTFGNSSIFLFFSRSQKLLELSRYHLRNDLGE